MLPLLIIFSDFLYVFPVHFSSRRQRVSPGMLLFHFPFLLKQKTPSVSVIGHRGREKPVVPPQFAAHATSWDTIISAALYRAHPAPPTAPQGFRDAARDGNWDAAASLPCTNRQLSEEDFSQHLTGCPSSRWNYCDYFSTFIRCCKGKFSTKISRQSGCFS